MDLFDRARFGELMAKVAIATNRAIGEPRLNVYWERLQDVPMRLFELAIDHWISHESNFPSIPKLRQAIDLVATTHPDCRSLPPVTFEPTEEHPVWCEDCQDTGWAHRERQVERGFLREGQPHHVMLTESYVVRCACLDRNPVIERRHAALRRYGTRDADAPWERRR